MELDKLDYTFLVFQEEFVNNFLSDKYFMYRLLYCYQHDYPTWFDMPEEEAYPLLDLLQKMKQELRNPIADSYHLIVAYLYQFLLLLNRIYAHRFNLPFALPLNKAVMREFGLSAVHLLKQRLLQEVKNDLLFSNLSVKEIAFRLHFSEPNHLMRFFKQMTGQAISAFLAEMNREIE